MTWRAHLESGLCLSATSVTVFSMVMMPSHRHGAGLPRGNMPWPPGPIFLRVCPWMASDLEPESLRLLGTFLHFLKIFYCDLYTPLSWDYIWGEGFWRNFIKTFMCSFLKR